MMHPTVHLNGTSKAMLGARLLDAGNALRDAIDALNEAAPTGATTTRKGPRDPGGHPGALRPTAAARSVQDELTEMYEHLMEVTP